MTIPKTSNPSKMTIIRAGAGIKPAPNGISNKPFLFQPLLGSEIDGEMTAMCAYFEPGVVPNWHSHPYGQLLFALNGVGQVQCENDEITEIRAGDYVWFAPNEPHWHGAAPDEPFSYICVQQVKSGKSVNWLHPNKPDGEKA